MIKIKILKNTALANKPLEIGETVSVSEEDAEILIGMGKAEVVDKKKKGK